MNDAGLAVQVRGLTKRFRAKRRGRAWLTPWRVLPPVEALRGVELEVRPGELVVLLGPNGAGKTTLLKVLSTLVRPTAGEARVMGKDVTRHGAEVRRSIGYVLAEERSFYWRLSCRDNLRFFGVLEGLTARDALARADTLGAMLGLTELMDRDFGSLSTGQRQRMAIARGLLADPPVLLFDEATRSLDPGRSERLRRIIRRVLVERERKAVLFATHDLEEARVLADRVILMREGRVAAAGSFEALAPEILAAFREESSGEEAEFRRLFPGLEGDS